MLLPQRLGTGTFHIRLVLIVVACIAVVIGVYSRLDHIAEVGMWADELHSIRLSDPSQSVAQLMEMRVANEGPPLYSLFLYELRRLGISSEAQMRFVQNALFIAGVLLLWTGLNPVSGALVRWIQSAFLIGSYGLIYYSSELRSYSLMIFLGTVQALLFLRIVLAFQKDAGIPHLWMIVFAVTSVALSLVHYAAAVAVGTSFVLLAGVGFATGRIRRLFTVAMYALAACLPVIGWFLATYTYEAGEAGVRHLISDPVLLVRQLDRFLRLLAGNVAAALCLAMLIASGAWTVVRVLRRESLETPIELRAAQWLGALALATWVMAYAFTIAVVPIVSMRNLLVTAPAIYLALACVIAFWLKSNRKIARAGIATSIIYFLLSAASSSFEFDPKLLNAEAKKDWVVSAQLINGRQECAGEPIVVIANRVEFYRHYIDSSRGIKLIPIGTSVATARPGDGRMEERVELFEDEMAQARELLGSSNCGVKMWYVPTAFVSEQQALNFGEQVLGAAKFRLGRVGNAMLFYAEQQGVDHK
jgi:hypothetical protein